MQIQYLATWWKRYNSFCKQRGQPIIYSNKTAGNIPNASMQMQMRDQHAADMLWWESDKPQI